MHWSYVFLAQTHQNDPIFPISLTLGGVTVYHLLGVGRWSSSGGSTSNKFASLISLHSQSRVTLYTAGHLHTAVPHCSHSRAPIVHTAVPRENNEHGCVYLRCTAVCKLPGCVEGHPCQCEDTKVSLIIRGYIWNMTGNISRRINHNLRSEWVGVIKYNSLSRTANS